MNKIYVVRTVFLVEAELAAGTKLPINMNTIRRNYVFQLFCGKISNSNNIFDY